MKTKYKRMKKALWAGASSGIVAGMILMGSGNTALAETSDLSIPSYTEATGASGVHMMRRLGGGGKKAGALAGTLGLDKEEVKKELFSGKTMKQILQEHGIVPGELEKAFEGRKNYNQKGWRKGLQS